MHSKTHIQIEHTLAHLYNDAKYDHLKMVKGLSKSLFRPIRPSDFKNVYLSISKEQGEHLKALVVENNSRNIVEFGTSFGISTLYLAEGALETGGKIITTELIQTKAQKALENFQSAGVAHLIEVRVGDALETLQNHKDPIDLLLLDGWKDVYLALFQMLASNFHTKTLIYVDNADMSQTKDFLKVVAANPQYQLRHMFQGKVVLITIKDI